MRSIACFVIRKLILVLKRIGSINRFAGSVGKVLKSYVRKMSYMNKKIKKILDKIHAVVMFCLGSIGLGVIIMSFLLLCLELVTEGVAYTTYSFVYYIIGYVVIFVVGAVILFLTGKLFDEVKRW